MDEHHVELEHYLSLSRGDMTPGEMLLRIHRHLVEGCDECKEAWESLHEDERQSVRDFLAEQKEAFLFDSIPPSEMPNGD